MDEIPLPIGLSRTEYMVAVHNSTAPILTPGDGLVTDLERQQWRHALSKLPEDVQKDPSAQFVNPALIPALLGYIRTAGDLTGKEQYQAVVTQPFPTKAVHQFANAAKALHAQRAENPYHSSFHTFKEVPDRLSQLYLNLKTPPAVLSDLFWVGQVAAYAHDLLHSGVGYVQRLTPHLNISNEERAVIFAAKLALAAGFNPIQAFEIQRQILPTSFFQKPHELGLDKDPQATFTVIGARDGATIPKAMVARPYAPDLAEDEMGKRAAQLLSLADVLVTMGSYEEWTMMAGKLFLEARIGSGFFPKTPEDFAAAQSKFLIGHVKARLEALKDTLREEFVSLHLARINEYSTRLLNAGQICAGKMLATDPISTSDAKLLKDIVDGYLNAAVTSLSNDHLDFKLIGR